MSYVSHIYSTHIPFRFLLLSFCRFTCLFIGYIPHSTSRTNAVISNEKPFGRHIYFWFPAVQVESSLQWVDQKRGRLALARLSRYLIVDYGYVREQERIKTSLRLEWEGFLVAFQEKRFYFLIINNYLLRICSPPQHCKGGSRIFLGGGALVSCSTSTTINHIVFFAEYQLY